VLLGLETGDGVLVQGLLDRLAWTDPNRPPFVVKDSRGEPGIAQLDMMLGQMALLEI
jgi:hypothetical protein